MAEEMYQTVLEGSGSAVVVLGEDMVISQANGGFERLCGLPKVEVEGKKSLGEFLVPTEVEPTRSGPATQVDLEFLLRQGEGRFRGAGGNVRDVRVTAARVLRTRKAVVSLLDITDSKQAKKSLHDLREIHQALVENAKETIMVIQDGWLKSCSSKILGISGYSEDELIAQPFQEFIHPEDRERFVLHLGGQEQEALSRVQSIRLLHKDGQIRRVEERGTRIQWNQNPAVLCFLTDVTDRKQTEEEVRNSIEPFRALIQALERYFQL
jgi:PAS domain S-box-containing protein